MCTSNNNDSYDDRKFAVTGGISDSPRVIAGKRTYYNAESEDFSEFFTKIPFVRGFRTVDEVLDSAIVKAGSGGGQHKLRLEIGYDLTTF